MHGLSYIRAMNAARAHRAADRPKPTLDDLVSVEDHGSIILLRPRTTAARRWLEDRTEDGAVWYCGALAVGPRFVENVLAGMSEELTR